MVLFVHETDSRNGFLILNRYLFNKIAANGTELFLFNHVLTTL